MCLVFTEDSAVDHQDPVGRSSEKRWRTLEWKMRRTRTSLLARKRYLVLPDVRPLSVGGVKLSLREVKQYMIRLHSYDVTLFLCCNFFPGHSNQHTLAPARVRSPYPQPCAPISPVLA